MKRVTLLIPDEYADIISIVLKGHGNTTDINVCQRLYELQGKGDDITLDICSDIKKAKEE